VIDAYENARKLLRDNKDLLEAVAKTLLERETIDGPDLDKIIEDTRSVAPA
jgi:cell division protease FtsH